MKKRPLYFQYITPQEDLEITRLLQTMLGSNSKSLAIKIGCDYQDMLNRITNQPRSPRKLELVIRILDLVENPEPFIRWFNLRYGFLPPVRKRKVIPTAETVEKQLIESVKEMGDISREYSKAYADKKLVPSEMNSIISETQDLVQSALELVEICVLIRDHNQNKRNNESYKNA